MAILHIDAQGGSDLSLLKSEYYTNPGELVLVKWSYSLGRDRFDAKFIDENKNYYSNPIETTYEFGDILVYWHCYGDGQVSCNVKARGSSSNLISFTHDNAGSRPVIEYYLDFAIDTTLKKGYFVVISLQHIPYEGNNWQEFIYLADGGEALYNLLVNASESGGAGSGYIGNSLLSNKKMVGYNVPTSSAEGTKTESVNDVSANPVSGKPKSGNGHVRIKFLREWEGHIWSTSEQVVGTWINGEPLYEITFYKDSDFAYNNMNNLGALPQNFERMVYARGYAQRDGNTEFDVFNTGDVGPVIQIKVKDGYFGAYISGYVIISMAITFRYTKSSN